MSWAEEELGTVNLGDGEPGARTLWLGLQEVSIFVEGARYARQIAQRTCV